MRWNQLIVVVSVAMLIVGGCGGGGNGLDHGLYQTSSEAVFWVALNGNIDLLLAAPKPLDYTQNENWDGSEFNVYYELQFANGRTPILVYGDVEEGIITAAYDNEPLDLDQGMFFTVRDGQPVAMLPAEKSKFISQIDL
jgi:hypothetical protein